MTQNVRRSSFHGKGGSRFGVFSPYRCRSCGLHFSVISRKFQGFVAVVGGLGVGATVVLLCFAAAAMVPELLALLVNDNR